MLDDTADVLAAALIQIAAHAERISGLDAREDAHYRDITAGLASIDRQIAAVATRLTGLTEGDEDDAGAGYQPVPAVRWWKLTGAEREAATARLRAWVEQIYQPGYGRIAATLPPCWEHHPLCLYVLDWLSELWSVLYLCQQRDDRTIAAQAEWHTRLLPAAAEQMASEAASCRHSPAALRRESATAAYYPPGRPRAGT